MTDRITAAETQIAHLQRTVDELSDVVAVQADAIARLTRRLHMLMEREAEREEGMAAPVDQKPPHY
jgi:SlyX protein